MSKWADYLISAVRYNDKHTHINQVKVHEDKGETVGSSTDWLRQSVINYIKKGYTFCTIVMGSDNKWQKGQKVIVVNIRGVEYIKTVDNGKESDNLENLPEY